MTTTPKDPVDAHLQLVYNFAGVVAQNLPWQAAYDAVEASARALAAVPAEPVEAAAWMHVDDPRRVISAIQKDGLVKDDGASASSVAGYSMPLIHRHEGAQQAGGVPAGWQVVPVEPTPKMLAALWAYKANTLAEQYDAMLAAAPSPSAVQPTVFQPGEYERMTENGAKAWAGVDPQKLRGAVQPPATSPQEATRSLGKWLNEHPNRPINLEDVAMLVHHVQAVQPLSEAQIAPMSEWRAEKMARDWVADQTTDAEDLIRQVEDFHGIVTPKEPK